MIKRLLFIIFFIFSLPAVSNENTINVFAGKSLIESLWTMSTKLVQFKPYNSLKTYLYTIDYERKIITILQDKLDLSASILYGRHFEAHYQKDFDEYVVYISGTWKDFSWNDKVYTKLIISEGVSYANKVPWAEEHDKTNRGTSKFLNYLGFEMSFHHPKKRNLGIGIRIHHRSGAFGTYNGVWGGSNVLGLTLKYSF